MPTPWAKNSQKSCFLVSVEILNSSDYINEKLSENASLFMKRLEYCLLPITGKDEYFYIL